MTSKTLEGCATWRPATARPGQAGVTPSALDFASVWSACGLAPFTSRPVQVEGALAPSTGVEPAANARLVSVVVPVYNGEAYIAAALDSVFAQTHQRLEVLVVDDGSTDGTLKILERYGHRLRVIRQTNQGHAAARNAAVAVATGEWVAMLDADDIWHPEKLAKQLDASEGVDVVYTAACNFGDSARVDPVTFAGGDCPEGDVFVDLLNDNFVTHSSVMFRRLAFASCGGYDESLKTTCDWDLWLRMAAAGRRFCGRREPLTGYRWRATSNSRNHGRTSQDRLLVVRRALATDRGRAIGPWQRRQVLSRVWQTSAWFVADTDPRTALWWYMRSLAWNPTSVTGWKEVARCALTIGGTRG